MKNFRKLFLILIILLTLGLAACTRSASKAPASVSEGDDISGGAEVTKAPIDILGEKATQTAIAESGGGKEVEAEPSGDTSEGESGAAAPEPETEDPAAEESAPPETDSGSTEESEPVVVPEDFGVPNKYTVKSGDHPYCIARRFNIDVATFFSVNGLSNESMLYPGSELVVPKDAGPFLGERVLMAHPTNYTVQAGDTLNFIACKFGDVDPRAIAAANGFGENYSLTPGDVIKIP